MNEEQNFNFDKFMDDIVIKEEQAKKQNRQTEETPQRAYIKKYREKPGNRIVYGGK